MITPKRPADDSTPTDDVLDIELEDNERVMQVDITKHAHSGMYAQRLETQEEANRRVAKLNHPGLRGMISSVGGTMDIAARDLNAKPKIVNIRVKKDMEFWRYRVATIEEVTGVTSGDGELVEDADVIEGENNQ